MDIDRFEAKVDRSGGPDACHPWTGAVRPSGHGLFAAGSLTDGTRRLVGAHVYAWELENGEVPVRPDGRKWPVDHECHNRDLSCPGGPACLHRRCCNPRHLAVSTDLLNTTASAACNAAKTHCPAGHPYDAENTYVAATGWRRCRTCHREGEARRRPVAGPASAHRELPSGSSLDREAGQGHAHRLLLGVGLDHVHLDDPGEH